MGPLDGYLPYLLNRAGSRIATAFSEEVRSLGATLQIWRVLAALRERDGCRMGDLSETTSIEVSTLTRLVDGMERKGLVARRRGDVDARAREQFTHRRFTTFGTDAKQVRLEKRSTQLLFAALPPRSTGRSRRCHGARV